MVSIIHSNSHNIPPKVDKVKAQGEVKRSPEIYDVNVKLGLKARQVL